jgi:hypothetical protein
LITNRLDTHLRRDPVKPHPGFRVGSNQAALTPGGQDRVLQQMSSRIPVAADHQVAVERQPSAEAVNHTPERALIPSPRSQEQSRLICPVIILCASHRPHHVKPCMRCPTHRGGTTTSRSVAPASGPLPMAGPFAGRSGLSWLFTASNGRRTQTRDGLGLHDLVFELVDHASYLHGLREVRNIPACGSGSAGPGCTRRDVDRDERPGGPGPAARRRGWGARIP